MASQTRSKLQAQIPPKPITSIWRPDLTRLPPLHRARQMFRRLTRLVARLLIQLLAHTTVSGFEHFPVSVPALIAINHLGDADTPLLLAKLPVFPEVLAKVEMMDFPIIGKLMDWYGMIWLHRGQPDRRALRCSLQALQRGSCLIIAPEGRYSLVKGLEPGGDGAAYLASRANVPVIPVALTGTENGNVYGCLRRFRRPRLSLTIGEPLYLQRRHTDRNALQEDTRRIMQALAQLLPEEYRGAYL